MLSFSPFTVCVFDKENKKFLMVINNKQTSISKRAFICNYWISCCHRAVLMLLVLHVCVLHWNESASSNRQTYPTLEGDFGLQISAIFWPHLTDYHLIWFLSALPPDRVHKFDLCSCAFHTYHHCNNTTKAVAPRHVRWIGFVGIMSAIAGITESATTEVRKLSVLIWGHLNWEKCLVIESQNALGWKGP